MRVSWTIGKKKLDKETYLKKEEDRVRKIKGQRHNRNEGIKDIDKQKRDKETMITNRGECFAEGSTSVSSSSPTGTTAPRDYTSTISSRIDLLID